jgi:hypothetical protein
VVCTRLRDFGRRYSVEVTTWTFRTALGPLAVGAVLIGCGLIPDGGDAIADALRAERLPTIQAIEYQRYDGLDGPLLKVFLVAGATRSDAMVIACQILPPIIAAHEPPEYFRYDVLDSKWGESLAADYDCP